MRDTYFFSFFHTLSPYLLLLSLSLSLLQSHAGISRLHLAVELWCRPAASARSRSRAAAGEGGRRGSSKGGRTVAAAQRRRARFQQGGGTPEPEQERGGGAREGARLGWHAKRAGQRGPHAEGEKRSGLGRAGGLG